MPTKNSDSGTQDKSKKLRFSTSAERFESQRAFNEAAQGRDDAKEVLALEKQKLVLSESALTKIKRDLADQLESHDAIKAKLTTRDEFLAIVSHDLRAPLSVISMSAEELTKLLGSEGEVDLQHQLIEIIRRNASTMERLILDLLDVERMASNKLLLNLANHDTNKIALDAFNSFLPVSKTKNISLSYNLPSNPCFIKCDRDRIQQVLSNLLSNAIKFTPVGGTILVEVNHCDAKIRISVSDTGQGIPDEQKTRIFERSTQLNRNDRRGLGLGLYISKWLIDAHDGNIGVESIIGQGSRFFFELPEALIMSNAKFTCS